MTNDHPAVTHSVIRQIPSTDPVLDKSDDEELLRAKYHAAQDSLKPISELTPFLKCGGSGLDSVPSHPDQTFLSTHCLYLLTSCNPGRLSVVSIFDTGYQLTSVF